MKQKSCPICGGLHLEPVLTLPQIPYLVNCLSTDEASAKQSGLGTQSIVQCRQCGFVFNQAFEAQNVIYGPGYHAERGFSAYYREHVRSIAEQINLTRAIKGARVLEVACGTGEFLQVVSEYQPQTCEGVDPSGDESDGNYTIQCALFDEAYLKRHSEPVDILINRHMIEHMEKPLEMLRLFAQALPEGGVLYLETPRLDWILENRVFYDFTYEHCSYYTDKFMERLLRAAGFSVEKMTASYGGQYFSILARKNGTYSDIEPIEPDELNRTKLAFEKTEQRYLYAKESCAQHPVGAAHKEVPSLCDYLSCLSDIYLWGASGKGVMCCNLLGKERILGCIDKNPLKAGKFIPGTGHPVIAPKDISYEKVKHIFVVNDVYLDEIREEISEIDPRIQVMSLQTLLEIGPAPSNSGR